MSKYKLLIVDDEYFIRDGISSFEWDRLGFEVIGVAENGKDAIQIIEKNDADVVLTDIRMPVMDGLELCNYIKKTHAHCKVVLLSGYKDFNYARTAIRAGASDYILKPVDMDELEELFVKIKNELDMVQGEKKNEQNNETPQDSNKSLSCKLVIKNAVEYMKRNYYEDLVLEDVANEVYLSPAYFSSQFKKEMNKSFSEYLNEIRIEKAKKLLKEANLKIYEIAEMVGYKNTKYFTDIFKKYTGMSPLQYRKN